MILGETSTRYEAKILGEDSGVFYWKCKGIVKEIRSAKRAGEILWGTFIGNTKEIQRKPARLRICFDDI